jgi:hypothetical protein
MRSRSKLHLFEMVLIWCMVTFLNQNFYYIATLNLKLLESTEREDLFWSLFVTRIVGMPILILWLFDYLTRHASLPGRTAATVFFLSLLAVNDLLMSYSGLLRFIAWSVWKSGAVWLAVLAITWLILLWYRSLLRKESFP